MGTPEYLAPEMIGVSGHNQAPEPFPLAWTASINLKHLSQRVSLYIWVNNARMSTQRSSPQGSPQLEASNLI